LGELLHGVLVEQVNVEDVLGRVRGHGLGSLDLRDGKWAALGDVERQVGVVLGRAVLLALALGVLAAVLLLGRGVLVLGRRLLAAGRLAGRRLLVLLAGTLLVAWHVEDVECPRSGGLDCGGLAGVVGDVVTIDDVVVPVPLAGAECGALKPKGALP